jgi:hypothetical protein
MTLWTVWLSIWPNSNIVRLSMYTRHIMKALWKWNHLCTFFNKTSLGNRLITE